SPRCKNAKNTSETEPRGRSRSFFFWRRIGVGSGICSRAGFKQFDRVAGWVFQHTCCPPIQDTIYAAEYRTSISKAGAARTCDCMRLREAVSSCLKKSHPGTAVKHNGARTESAAETGHGDLIMEGR